MKVEPKRLIMAGGTLVCALGIGYFMQSTAHPGPPATSPEIVTAGLTGPANTPKHDVQVLQPPESETKSNAPVVALDEITLASAAPAQPASPAVASLPVVNAAFVEPDTTLPGTVALDTPSSKCDYTLTATPEAAAMVRLSMTAPCMTNARFTLHHNGMMITEVTDAAGLADLLVPALSTNAVFIAAFAGGEGAVGMVDVPTLDMYERAVIQWKGTAGMQIHAREFGAAYGSAGHIWSEASQTPTVAEQGKGGFVTRHGAADLDDAFLAEVYTFPTGTISRDGDVALTVETEVTDANCGRDVEAQAIQKEVGGALKSQDLVLSIPDCDAVGDILVLKNLLNDLKVAAR